MRRVAICIALSAAACVPAIAETGPACGGPLVVEAVVPPPLPRPRTDGPGPLLLPAVRLAASSGDRPAGAVLTGLVLPVAAGEAAALALQARLDALSGAAVRLHQPSARKDRRGRAAGQIERADGTWLQADILREGLAVFDGTDGPCAASLAAAEAEARAARRGVWADRLPLAVAARPTLPDFVVAEGRILSVGKSGATTYLNFGRSFRTDFTVRISRRNSAGFGGEDAIDGLAGRLVRVRGWAVARDGVDLPIQGPAALEAIDETREVR